jgi:hypothetical protein
MPDSEFLVRSLPVDLQPAHQPTPFAGAEKSIHAEFRLIRRPGGIPIREIVVTGRDLRGIQVEGVEGLIAVEYRQHAERSVEPESLRSILGMDQ